jgi:hypothetical protein
MARRKTNEMEFQGRALQWINEEIQRRPGLGLDKATQEKPRAASGKRNDLVVWVNRNAEAAFLEIELKTPDTSISDPTFLADAIEKAQQWNAPFFAIWNMREAELYRTPPPGKSTTPGDAIRTWRLDPLITSVDSPLSTHGLRIVLPHHFSAALLRSLTPHGNPTRRAFRRVCELTPQSLLAA